jgi:hypothetical protein
MHFWRGINSEKTEWNQGNFLIAGYIFKSVILL